SATAIRARRASASLVPGASPDSCGLPSLQGHAHPTIVADLSPPFVAAHLDQAILAGRRVTEVGLQGTEVSELRLGAVTGQCRIRGGWGRDGAGGQQRNDGKQG